MRGIGWMKWMVLAGLAFAGPGWAGAAGGPPGGPPAEALQACASLAVGATCSFTVDGRQLSGTCRTGPNGEAAACMPDHPHGPPPEAFQACSGLQEGAGCTVTLGQGQMEGTCRAGPDGGPLACAPSQASPR